MKKFLVFMLGVLIALPSIARDFTYEYEEQTLTYTVRDWDAKTCIIKEGESHMKPGNNVSGVLVIPPIAKDGDIEFSVVSIGNLAFANNKGLTSVTIPESVTSIGDNAFDSCEGLTSVTIGNSVNDIRYSAFRECRSLTTVDIPNSVTLIGVKAFQYSGLTSVILPASVTSVQNDAFDGCENLVKLAYPSGLDYHFKDGSCSIEYPREGSIMEDGFIYGSDKDVIYYAPISLEGEFIIPESIKGIGKFAFGNCRDLTSVSIPNSVTTIEERAFRNCTGLTSVIIPNSVTSIGGSVFSGCTGLTSVIIPNSVTSIGNYAFSDCTGLTSVIIPNSVTSIGNYAFSDCTGLTSMIIPDSVTSIGNYAFSDCTGLTSMIIPNSVTSIGNYAFSRCTGLTSMIISNSVTTIEIGTFSDCTGLTEVILPPSVKHIRYKAFSHNSKLVSIIMGHNVETIGESAFADCPAQIVSITAQTPPRAYNNTFSDYTGSLYVQGQETVNAYYYAESCWDKFKGHVMIESTEIKTEGDKTFNGKPGDTFQLTATLYPENVTLPYVFWRSNNPDIATVDANGLITLHANMSEVMSLAESDDDTAIRSCKIIAESLYANGPVAEFTVNDTSAGIEHVINDSTASGDIDYNAPVEVCNLQGVMVGNNIENLAPGIYIVRQGNIVKKIAVK